MPDGIDIDTILIGERSAQLNMALGQGPFNHQGPLGDRGVLHLCAIEDCFGRRETKAGLSCERMSLLSALAETTSATSIAPRGLSSWTRF